MRRRVGWDGGRNRCRGALDTAFVRAVVSGRPFGAADVTALAETTRLAGAYWPPADCLRDRLEDVRCDLLPCARDFRLYGVEDGVQRVLAVSLAIAACTGDGVLGGPLGDPILAEMILQRATRSARLVPMYPPCLCLPRCKSVRWVVAYARCGLLLLRGGVVFP